ncbi:MAG TPA: hypothetical protein IAB69_05365, partial [Candidatus Coproplasma excrementigallinarum]|nr:hypothetical protein [Candidatus Coproplasma excrementigallinarum]
IVKELTINAQTFTTTINVDSILQQFTDVDFTVGDVVLTYNTANDTLTGSALDGGLAITVTGSETIVSAPAVEDYRDVAEVLNSVKDILESNSVGVKFTLTGSALADLLKANNIADLGESVDGLSAEISGNVNISGLAANVLLLVKDGDREIVNASVYYLYGTSEEGKTNYGTAYISIANLLGESVNIKVKCNIADTITSVKALITAIQQELPAVMAETTAAEEQNNLADTIAQILAIDFGNIVKELTINAKAFSTTINVDSILQQFTDVDFTVGDVTLTYDVANDTLTGSALNNGLAITVTGSEQTVSAPAVEDYRDITEVLNSVKDILSSPSVGVKLTLTGSALADLLKANGIADLGESVDGLSAEIVGNVDISGLAANVTLVVKDGDKEIVNASVYYAYSAEQGGYGTAYINISNILGVKVDLRVKCNIADTITSVNALISAIQQEVPAVMTETATEEQKGLADTIAQILAIDFGNIVKELTINAKAFTTTINVDSILQQFTDVDFTVGDVTLAYDVANDTLTGNALNGGLGITVTGSETTVSAPTDIADYRDVAAIIDLIKEAADIANSIKEAQSINFNVDFTVNIGEVSLLVNGKGEVEWGANGVVTAVALDLGISAYRGQNNNTITRLTFVYDASPAYADGTAEPVIIIGINDSALKIAQSDINKVQGQIAELVAAIEGLTGSGSTSGAQGGTAEEILLSLAEASGNPAVSTTTGGNYAVSEDTLTVISAVLRALGGDSIFGDMFRELVSGTLSLDELEEQLTYRLDGVADITVSVKDGRLTLSGAIGGEGSEIIEIRSVTAGAGTAQLSSALMEEFEGENFRLYSSENDEFIKVVYDYILDCFDNIDLGDLLGDDAFKISMELRGNASGFEELAGIYVRADLYIADGVENGKITGRLAGLDFDVQVDDFRFSATLVYNSGWFYILIDYIEGTELTDLKVKISAEDTYSAVKSLLALVQNKQITDLFAGIMGDGSQSTTEGEGRAISEESETKLTDILIKLLEFDYKSVIKVAGAEGSAVISADIDELLAQFGVYKEVGNAIITLGGKGGNIISVDVVTDKYADREDEGLKNLSWLSLDVGLGEIEYPDLDGYVDVNFLDEIVDDASKFVLNNKTETGDVSLIYTFLQEELSVSVDIISGVNATISISDLYISVGLGEDNGLYLSLKGNLSAAKVTLGFIPISLTEEAAIGITYSDGYITLSKTPTGGNTSYWIMTPEYFIDHLFAEQNGSADSPIRWLLGMGSTLWGMVTDMTGDIDFTSGLADPEELYLYSTQSGSSAGQQMSMFDYINGFYADIGGEKESSFGEDFISFEKLGVAQDYYAFSLDLASLTGGAVGDLDVALIRDEVTGFSAIKAYAYLADMIELNLNLEYQGTQKKVTNYFDKAVGAVAEGSEIDFGYYDKPENDSSSDYADWIFGGVMIAEDGTLGYDYSERLVDDYVTVYVYDTEGNPVEGLSGTGLRYGSTVYLYSMEHLNYITVNGASYAVIYAVEGSENSDNLPQSIVLDNSNIKTDEQTGEKYIKIYAVQTADEVVHLKLVNVLGDGTTEIVDDDYAVFMGGSAPVDVYTGYTLLDGIWYTDVSCTEIFEGTVNGDMTLYGKFIRNEYTDENGVIYTFTQDENGSHYEVSGTNNYISPYFAEDKTLVLKSSIGGYAVTAIRANAFSGLMLKNVIVPETVTYVGELAFADNYGIKSVTFLADSVTFAGSVANKNTPFYGCSEASGGNTSALTVYYNSAVYNGATESSDFAAYKKDDWGKSDENWRLFCVDNDSNLRTDVFYYFNAVSCADGGSSWAVTDYNITLNGSAYNDQFGELTAKLPVAGTLFTSLTPVSAAEIIAAVTEAIDSFTAKTYGYIGRYTVDVDENISLSGHVVVNISITDGGEGAAMYPVTVESLVNQDGQSSSVPSASTYSFDEASVKQFGGKIYAKQGEIYVRIAAANTQYEILSVTADGALLTPAEGVYTFTMPARSATIVVNLEYVEQNTVQVYSAVSFSYGGGEYAAGVGTVVVGEETVLGAPEAVGYTFLGWAAEAEGDALTFVTENVTVDYDGVYYAIWAKSSEAIDVSGVVTGGNSGLGAPAAVSGTTFYRWYAGEGFATQFTAISTDVTVVTARWQYKLEFSLEYNSSNLVVNNSNVGEQKLLSYDVVEGNYVDISYSTGTYSHGLFNIYKSPYTLVTVTVRDAVTGESSQLVSFYLQSTSSNSNTRCFRPYSYQGEWTNKYTLDKDGSSRLSDSSSCAAAATSICMTENSVISYSA